MSSSVNNQRDEKKKKKDFPLKSSVGIKKLHELKNQANLKCGLDLAVTQDISPRILLLFFHF